MRALNKRVKSLQGSNLFRVIRQTLAIFQADMLKLKHNSFELFTRMLQPALWFLVFGQSMAHINIIEIGEQNYIDFIAPGILAQSILFAAIFYGISLIWDKDMGILHKILVSPCPRFSLVVGRALAAGVRGLSQAVVIFFLALLMQVNLQHEAWNIIGIIVFVFLGAAVFSTISLIAASIVKKRERFMGIGQTMTMPLFFASNALYPINMMPDWLKAASHFNPLTYQVDAFRTLMIRGNTSSFGLATDFFILLITFIVMAIIATKLYPKIIE